MASKTGKKLSMQELKLLRQSRNHVCQAREKERQDDHSTARQCYEEALKVFPGSVEARVGLGQLLWADAADAADLLRVEETYKLALKAAEEASSQQEIDMAKIAETKLCLLLCQEGRDSEARELLLQAGFEYRLAECVLRYSTETIPGVVDPAEEERLSNIRVVDNALPQYMLTHLQTHFTRGSPFWREHDYNSEQSEYFSYLHVLNPEPASNFEQVIHHVWLLCTKLRPEVGEAKFCEWWSHCRPHSSGHQLHFDSDDEGTGGVRNPIVSTVIYLTEGIGGPTLVTNQRITGSSLANKGWYALPTINRIVMFDGKVLHGVIPGRGCCSRPGERRVTLMLAFWRDVAMRSSEHEEPGANRPFPTKGRTKYTWPDGLYDRVDEWDKCKEHNADEVFNIASVERVWTRVDGQNAAEDSIPDYSQCFQGF